MRFFNTPTQVKFLEPYVNCPAYAGGIAYEDKVICGCCGSVFEIEEIYNGCEVVGYEPIVVFDDWVNLGKEILGEE